MTASPAYQTTVLRVFLALSVAAALPALLPLSAHLWAAMAGERTLIPDQQVAARLLGLFAGFWVFWLACFCLFGGLAWSLMHAANKRRLHHAMIAGFFVPAVVLLLFQTNFLTGVSRSLASAYASGGQQWENYTLTAYGWRTAFVMSFQIGLAGIVHAMVIWRIAYRRA